MSKNTSSKIKRQGYPSSFDERSDFLTAGNLSAPEYRSNEKSDQSDKNFLIREHILLTALELFAAHGFKAVTIKQIGDRAEITASLIYYYFRDKEKIFQECIKVLIDHVGNRYLVLTSKDRSALDMLASWFNVHKEMTLEIRQLVKVIFDYSKTPNKSLILDELIDRFYSQERQIISEAIRIGIEVGDFRDCDAESLATFASVHLDGIISRSLITRQKDIDDQLDMLHAVMMERLGYLG